MRQENAGLWKRLFDGMEDPRTTNAVRRSIHEMLTITRLCMVCGGRRRMRPGAEGKQETLHDDFRLAMADP